MNFAEFWNFSIKPQLTKILTAKRPDKKELTKTFIIFLTASLLFDYMASGNVKEMHWDLISRFSSTFVSIK